MSEITRIKDQLSRAYRGEAWHGPALMESLKGVNAEQAAGNPIGSAHSIWELVLHIVTWLDLPRRRLQGDNTRPTDEQDWPVVTDTSDTAWTKALELLDRTQTGLEAQLDKTTDQQLEDLIPGTDITNYILLHGVIQHNLYHAGQIVLLKKAMG